MYVDTRLYDAVTGYDAAAAAVELWPIEGVRQRAYQFGSAPRQ